MDASAPEWLDAAIGKVQSFAELPANWNSYGAFPIQPEAIARAVEFLQFAAENMPRVRMSAIVPLPAGGVQFEWESGRSYAEIEVYSSRCRLYIEWTSGGSFAVETDGMPREAAIPATALVLGVLRSAADGTDISEDR